APAAAPGVAPPDLLHDTGRVAALYRDKGSEALIVSIAPRQPARDIWGAAYLARFGVSVLGLTDYSAGWFPQGDMAELLPRLQPVLDRHRRIILYGFSMGAYAALKYSARLRADVVLAFSPQASVHPDDVGDFDFRRSRDCYRPELHAGMRIAPGDIAGQALLFHDPRFEEDARHAALIEAAGPVQRVLTPLVNHDSIGFAVDTGWVRPMLQAALDTGRVPDALLRPLVRPRRLVCASYARQLAALMRRRHPGPPGEAIALRVLRQALIAGNATAQLRLELAHCLLDNHHLPEAQAVVRAGFIRPPRPSQMALLDDLHRRLRLRAGQDDPEPATFPKTDRAWAEVVDFLAERRLDHESLLAPAALAAVLPHARSTPTAPGEPQPDWVVVRKGGLAQLGRAFLRRLNAEAVPVFINGQFLVWSREPSFGLVDQRGHPEVAAMLRDLDVPWGDEAG
uniref:hypothetical protein n=1 Tax=Roseomonas sp. 18066 TaxID=2681412 RepID=UPI00135BD838